MIINADCLDYMKTMESNSMSSIVTDPPYGLSFMGKDWDHSVPGKPYWEEAIRVTKPGGFILAMGGTRTFHRLACAIEDSGWEIRDTITWLYGSGFPKSHNHFGIEGYGTALKPAYEPIIMAMKPIDKTFANNATVWGQAGINIDGSRIGEEILPSQTRGISKIGTFEDANGNITPERKGRWPANVILDEESGKMLGDPSRFFYCAKASSKERNEGLEEFPDRIPVYSREAANGEGLRVSDSKLPRKNNHPTVKPLELMEYLITLVMPPKDGVLLDPFAGSGTTILAAQRLGFKAIGIEKSAEYCEIANARIKARM